MEKIQLVILGLSASPAASNAYALILKEADGDRRLPIIIGAFEAQAIALEMEGVMPPRPMTHDLFKNMIEAFGGTLTEVFINDLVDGTFYAKLVFEDLGIEIDSRPSDAIAIAVRMGAPIYVNSDVLTETALMPQPGEDKDFDEPDVKDPVSDEDEEEEDFLIKPQPIAKEKPKTGMDLLQSQLDKAITDEDYERAAKLRDEINTRLKNS